LLAVMRVADVGVLHLDVALRNFVVKAVGRSAPPQVRMIDFGLAISALAPLQKPLWILPHADQHPRLREGIVQDWRAFFERNRLSPPAAWDREFDIPSAVYSTDWTRNLHVDAIVARRAILAHSLGVLVQRVGAMPCAAQLPPGLQRAASECLNLQDEETAAGRIDALMACLPAVDAGTPRPRARPRDTPPSDAATTTEPPPPSGVADALAPSPARGAAAWRLAGGTLLTLAGFGLADFIYVMRGFDVTDFSLETMLLLAAAWCLLATYALFKADRMQRWVGLLWLPALALATLAVELWAYHGQADGLLALLGVLPIAIILVARP
jgi:hypothetical protein